LALLTVWGGGGGEEMLGAMQLLGGWGGREEFLGTRQRFLWGDGGGWREKRCFTVKNAVELLGAPSRNSVLMLKKYNITDEIFWLSSNVFFFYPANEQESLTLAQSKNFVLVSD
jgi:hypothetical protein